MPRTSNRRLRSAGSACLTLAALLALAWLATAARPTPALAQAGETTFVRRLSLTVNDVVYSSSTKMLYASVPSSVGAGGNSIATINPATGEVVSSVFVGSEPNRLALSDDGHTLYVSLDGAFSIRRFDIVTQTPGLQFPTGQDSIFGGLFAIADIAVAPGNPDLVAVARQFRGLSPPEAGVAVFDNGVQRPKTGPGHIDGSDFLAFSATASKLYGSGFFGGLKTMTVDATGVTQTGSTTFTTGGRIKFDNGLIYASTGQVINPDAGTLLGTFSVGTSSGAFAPDSAAGRAYYVSRDSFSSSALVLKAFDSNTFVSTGTSTLNGITGDPTHLVRWGANGLAFRNTLGQLFLIQTTLIPSSEAVPAPTPLTTPTPTPTPTPADVFVRQLQLATNDLAYNAADQTIYASVPSSAGASGNSITKINPAAGTVGSSVFVGSEPGTLVLSDDGQTLYVGLGGAGAVRRFDVATQTAGLQFSLGNNSFNGPFFADDIDIMPGSPGTVAVSLGNSGAGFGGTSIFDNGVARPNSSNSGGSVAFGSATTLFVGSTSIQKNSVTASGLSQQSIIPTGRGGRFIFNRADGLIYTTGGEVIDPATGTVKGTFTTGLSFDTLMTLDAAAGRIYFLTNTSSSGWVLRAFDINTFLPLGSANVPGLSNSSFFGGVSSLVRWGANGFAFRTGSDRKVWLVQTSLVPSAEAVPTPTPTPSPTPTPTPVPIPTFVRRINLPANDLIYNPATQNLYASVPSSAGAGGNSITPITPSTGAVGAGVFIGSEPNKLALADDDRTLYVTLDGASAVRRFDLSTQTPGLQFTPSSSFQRPHDMAVVPGSPQSVVLAAGFNGAAVYDDGVQRPNVGKGNTFAVNRIEFDDTPTTLYGYDNESSGFELVKLTVGPTGISGGTTSVWNLISGFGVDIKFNGGRLYSTAGRVVDPAAARLLGTFQSSGNALAVDQTLHRAFFVSGSGSNATLTAFDTDTFLPVGTVSLPGVTGTPTSLVRWGANGLAFRTAQSFGSTAPESRVYVIQSALVSASAPLPTGIQLGADQFAALEGSSPFSFTVTRTGDISGTTTVDYVVGGGTATPVSDYTPASGTLTFAPGEQSKSVPVALTDDNVFERRETVVITLSNPGGGALLLSPATATVNIDDFDQQPFISVSNARVNETNTGTAEAVFTVQLTNLSSEPVAVNYATANGTATAGSDYVAASGTLNFPPLATSATIKVTLNGDFQIEPNETFFVNLSGATGGLIISSQGVGTIVNDDAPGTLAFSSASLSAGEGSGGAAVTVNRLNGATGTVTVNYSTAGGTAAAGSDYTAVSGTLTFVEGETSKTINVPILNDTLDEPDETVVLTLSQPTGGALLGTVSAATLTIVSDDKSSLKLSAATYSAPEGGRSVEITVVREGDTSAGGVSVDYATIGDAAIVPCALTNGLASERCDYMAITDTLRFAPGEATKSFQIPVIDDTRVEGTETFTVELRNPRGAVLSGSPRGTVTINDNDTDPAAENPIYGDQFFVRQHYLDFLGREPDGAGFAAWTSLLGQCSPAERDDPISPKPCDRTEVSSAFFRSPEFQLKGYFVLRFYLASLGRLPTYAEYIVDVQAVTGQTDQDLADKRAAFPAAWVARQEFRARYDGLSNEVYVERLVQTAGVTLANHEALVEDLNAGRKDRAQVLLAVVESAEVFNRHFNAAFVAMSYFGYLRRDPDPVGYQSWLDLLNQTGDYSHMVWGAVYSPEYKLRFGSVPGF